MRSPTLIAAAALALAPAAQAADSPDADLVVGLPLLRVVRSPSVTFHVPTWDEAVQTHADLFLLSHYLVERSTEPIPIPWLKGLGKTTALPLAPAQGSPWRGWRS
jgi:hypothetical protein